MVFLQRVRFGHAWYYYWDRYHNPNFFCIWTCGRSLLDSVWAADSLSNKVIMYKYILAHIWPFLLVSLFMAYGLKGVAVALIYIVLTV